MTGFYIEQKGEPYWRVIDGATITMVWQREEDALNFAATNWHLMGKDIVVRPARDEAAPPAQVDRGAFFCGKRPSKQRADIECVLVKGHAGECYMTLPQGHPLPSTQAASEKGGE